MTEPDREPDSPWASDAVPVPPEAAPIVWDTTTVEPVDESRPDHRAVPTNPVTGPVDPTPSWASPRRWRWPAAILVAASILAVAAVWQSADDSIDGAATVDTASIPEASVDENDPPGPAPTIATEWSAPTAEAADPVDREVPPGGVVDLPEQIAAIDQPTELVIQTADDLIHTLSLPSGRLRTVDSPEDAATSANQIGPGSVSIVAAPSGSLLGGYNHDLIVVPRVGRAAVVDAADFGLEDPPFGQQISPIGWTTTSDGSDLFLVSTYDVEAGVEREFTVDTSGTVAPSPAITPAAYETRVETRGHHMVNDAGGVYLVENDGSATRISSGTAIAASETDVLLRECDAERQCRHVLQSIEGDRRTPTGILPAEVAVGAYGLSLSPDGTAVSYTTYGITDERVIVDFADGVVATTPSSDYSTSGAWAPDGSGEFLAAEAANGSDGLVFLDRASGRGVPFGEQLGRVVGIAVRYPDSELEPSVLVEPTPIEFVARDGASTDLRLVAMSGAGEMTLLDLDEATAAHWSTRPLPGPAAGQLFADGERVGGYTESNGGSGFVSEFGAMTTSITTDRVHGGPRFPGPDGLVWARVIGDVDSGVAYDLVDLDGRRPASDGLRIRIRDATLLGGDGRSGLVFASGGDIYSSDGQDVDRLTSGELLAIGPTTALVRECDDRLRCAAFVVDRDSQERTESLDPLADATGAGADRAVSLIGSMSPDGSVALVDFASPGTSTDQPETVEKWFFFDLETGNPIGAARPDDGQPIVWNADSTHAAYVTDRTVVVYERATGVLIDVPGTDGTRSLTGVDPAFS